MYSRGSTKNKHKELKGKKKNESHKNNQRVCRGNS